MTIALLFDPRSNSLNALRLALAALVIVSHSIPLGGYGVEANLAGMNLGTWAVLGFFSISGFLITRSRETRPARAYYRARVLRIMPAFVVCLVIVAFVLAPISLLLTPGTWDASSATTYVLRNLPLYPPYLAQQGIGATLTDVPHPGVWNGPLWTLFWEVACYTLIGVVVSLLPRRAVRWTVLAAFCVITLVSLLTVHEQLQYNTVLAGAWPMILAFLSGALLYYFRNTLRVLPIAVVSVVLLATSIATASAAALAPLPIAILMLALGKYLPLQRVGAKRDISYGVYIYGWPIQQLLAAAGLGALVPLPLFAVAAIVASVPLALASFVFVERPAMRLGRSPSQATAAVVAAPLEASSSHESLTLGGAQKTS